MTEQLGALAPSEEPDLVPSIHVRQLRAAFYSSYGNLTPSSGFAQVLHTHVHALRYTHIHLISNKQPVTGQLTPSGFAQVLHTEVHAVRYTHIRMISNKQLTTTSPGLGI